MTEIRWKIVKDGIRQNQGALEIEASLLSGRAGRTIDFSAIKIVLKEIYKTNSCLRAYPLDAYGASRDDEREPGIHIVLNFKEGALRCDCNIRAYDE